MKVIALVFDYDLNKLSSIGRRWAGSVYKNKDFIFEYSAASYATFIDKNPTLLLNVYTDDVVLLSEKIGKYCVDLDNLILHDYNERLSCYENLDYCFWILFDNIKENRSLDEYTVKIDNDMVFVDAIPNMADDDNRVMMWKREHHVDRGNPLWGERLACEVALGSTDFYVYNVGLLGLPISVPVEEVELALKGLVGVDISGVTDVGSRIYHCCEQTAWNWIFHKYKYDVVEAHPYVRHHFADKKRCIVEARYLLK